MSLRLFGLDPKENSISDLEEQPGLQKDLNGSEETGFGCRHSGGSDSPGHSVTARVCGRLPSCDRDMNGGLLIFLSTLLCLFLPTPF